MVQLSHPDMTTGRDKWNMKKYTVKCDKKSLQVVSCLFQQMLVIKQNKKSNQLSPPCQFIYLILLIDLFYFILLI